MTIKKRLFSAGSRWLLFPWLAHYEASHPLHWCASIVVALQVQLFPSHLHIHSSAPALHFSKSSYFPADPGFSRHAWLCSSIREWQHPRLGSHNPFLVLRDEIQTENGEMGFMGEQKTFVCQDSSLSPSKRLLWSHARGRYPVKGITGFYLDASAFPWALALHAQQAWDYNRQSTHD